MTVRVSVALCTFDGEAYLPTQLESLATQEHVPAELVVCDDGSTDATLRILEDFAERAPFPVRIHRNPETLGPTKNFERAIGLCTGDAIALCDQDDVWLPERLSRAADVLAAEPEVGMTFSDAELIDETGAPTGERLWDAVRFPPALRERASEESLLAVLFEHDVVTGATMAFRTGLRDRVCPIPEAWHHDAWASLICAFVAGHRMFPEPLVRYRVHGEQEVGVFSGPDDRGRRGPRSLGGLGRHESHRPWMPTSLRRAVWRGDERRRLFRVLAERNREAAEWLDLAARRAGKERPLEDPAAEGILVGMEERARHYRVRGDLPGRRRDRFPGVLDEWRRGGYRRSSGAVSALRDLLA